MFCSQKKSRGFLIYGLVFRKEKKLEALLKPNLERSNILRRRKIRPWKSKIRGGKKKRKPKIQRFMGHKCALTVGNSHSGWIVWIKHISLKQYAFLPLRKYVMTDIYQE